eukprot:scaffold126378_cov32-Cyclotella_meneghiniana.AAC.1
MENIFGRRSYCPKIFPRTLSNSRPAEARKNLTRGAQEAICRPSSQQAKSIAYSSSDGGSSTFVHHPAVHVIVR